MPSFKIIRHWVLKRGILKGLTIYGHDGHLGHVAKTIFISSCSPLPKKAQNKIWPFIGQAISEMFENNDIYHIHMCRPTPQGRSRLPLCVSIFKNINLSSILSERCLGWTALFYCGTP